MKLTLPSVRLVAFITITIIISTLSTSCATNSITRKQKEFIQQHVTVVAAAIKDTVTEVKTPLYEYHAASGQWPASEEDQEEFSKNIATVLERHHIDKIHLASVDNSEVIVEFFIASKSQPKLPPLMESWLIVFSTKAGDQIEIVSVYPVWGSPDDLAASTSYSKGQITSLQQEFKRSLTSRLKGYSIQLNENLS